jgi:hypothetical protein
MRCSKVVFESAFTMIILLTHKNTWFRSMIVSHPNSVIDNRGVTGKITSGREFQNSGRADILSSSSSRWWRHCTLDDRLINGNSKALDLLFKYPTFTFPMTHSWRSQSDVLFRRRTDVSVVQSRFWNLPALSHQDNCSSPFEWYFLRMCWSISHWIRSQWSSFKTQHPFWVLPSLLRRRDSAISKDSQWKTSNDIQSFEIAQRPASPLANSLPKLWPMLQSRKQPISQYPNRWYQFFMLFLPAADKRTTGPSQFDQSQISEQLTDPHNTHKSCSQIPVHILAFSLCFTRKFPEYVCQWRKSKTRKHSPQCFGYWEIRHLIAKDSLGISSPISR